MVLTSSDDDFASLSSYDALKHNFTSLKTNSIFQQLRFFLMKLFHQYMAIFFNPQL